MAFVPLMEHFRTSVLRNQHMYDNNDDLHAVRRRPRAVDFSPSDPMSMEFLYATANLYAHAFFLPPVRDRTKFQRVVEGLLAAGLLVQPEFQRPLPSADQEEHDELHDRLVSVALTAELNQIDTAKLARARTHELEVDDDTNFHVDFLTAATNLRAWNFNIHMSERADVKVVAGQILPTLVTTTAMCCGLMDIEFCKLVLGLQNLGTDAFFSHNINLAVGNEALNAFNPQGPPP